MYFTRLLRINWETLFNGLLGLFSLCGFCPTLIDKSRKYFVVLNIILVAWSFVHVAVAITLAIFAFQTFMLDDSGFASFNNILKFSIMVLTYFATCLESFFSRNNFVEIWTRIKTADDLIQNLLPNHISNLNKFYKDTTRKIILAMLFTIGIELIIISNVYDVYNWRSMWIISIIPVIMSRFRHLHHQLFIELLSYRFRVIKTELKSIVRYTKIEDNKSINKNFLFYDGLFKKLSTIKSVYNTLWETSLLINRSFGVSQLINLLQNFIQLTCDLYMVYSFLYKNNMTHITGNLITINFIINLT